MDFAFPYSSDEYGDEEDEDCSSDGGWINWFCSLEGHDFFVEVDEDFIRDNFNLYGLRMLIDSYDRSLEMILGAEPPDDYDLMESEFLELYRDATDLYGLIHARYILSPKGLAMVREKYLRSAYGVCPRALCDRERVLPVGLSDELRTHRVRVYCPKCQECYEPRDVGNYQANESAMAAKPQDTTGIDGAYFGTSFPHVFLQTYSHLVPLDVPKPFVPKIFGFRIHQKKSAIARKIEDGQYGELARQTYQRRSARGGSGARTVPRSWTLGGGQGASSSSSVVMDARSRLRERDEDDRQRSTTETKLGE